MPHRRVPTIIAVLSALLLLAAACGNDDGGGGVPGGDTGAAGEPRSGGRIVIGVPDEPVGGFYPATSAVGAGGNVMAMAIFDTLTVVDASGEFVPYLAESFEPNDDNTVWRVTLREGILFSDETPLDAAALKDNFDRMDAAERPIEPGFTSEVVDDMVLEVTFPIPYGPFPAAMSSPYAWIASPTAMAEMTEEEFDENPVGTGPYIIKEWARDAHLILERNPHYWRADEGLPYLDEVEFRVILLDSSRVDALETGDVDAITLGDIDIARFRDMTDRYNVHETTQGVSAIVYNNSLPLLSDQRVRLGLSQAIDVDTLLESVWEGVGQRAKGPIPGDNPFFTDVDYPSYDPEAARELLEEYTEETGTPVSFALSFGEGTQAQEIAQLLQQYWQDVGAQVTLREPYNASDFPAIMATHEYEVALYGVPGFVDPDVWLYIEFRSDAFLNLGAIDSPEIDAALSVGHGSTDFDERKDAYAEVQRVLAEEVQWFFLRDEVLAVAARADIGGLGEFPLPDGSMGITKQGQFYTAFAVEALWRSE